MTRQIADASKFVNYRQLMERDPQEARERLKALLLDRKALLRYVQFMTDLYRGAPRPPALDGAVRTAILRRGLSDPAVQDDTLCRLLGNPDELIELQLAILATTDTASYWSASGERAGSKVATGRDVVKNQVRPNKLRIRAHREQTRMSTRDLGDRAGCGQDVIERLERGERTTIAVLRAVAAVFGVPPGDWIEPDPDPPATFAEQIQQWFDALGYHFADDPAPLPDGGTQWVIKVRSWHGFDRILVRCVEAEAQVWHLHDLQRAVDQAGTTGGWLIVPHLVGPAVRDVMARDEMPKLRCYNYDELLDRDVDFGPYFRWLEGQIKERRIDEHYVPLSCTRAEYHPHTQQKLAVAHIDEHNGGLKGYLDQWLDAQEKMHVCILGGFGTGKTWTALHYAYRAMTRFRDAKERGLRRPRIPIYVSLRDYTKALTVESLFSDFFFRKYEILHNYSAFDYLNRMGKLLIIFDGFDEMASRTDKERIVNGFWELARVIVPGAKAVLTGRLTHLATAVESRQLLSGKVLAAADRLAGDAPQFEVVDLELFDEDQLRRALLLRGTSPQVIERVLANDGIKELARRPLLLEFILAVLPEWREETPLDNAHVFLAAVRQTMERKFLEKTTFTSMADKVYFLCEVSAQMLNENQMSLHYTEFPQLLRTLFGDRVARPHELDYWRSDLLNQAMMARDDEGTYTVAHRSLAEFFTAYKFVAQLGVLAPEFLALAQQRNDVDPRLPPQEYTWSAYWQRTHDEQGKASAIAPLSNFVPDGGAAGPPQPFVRSATLSAQALSFAGGMVSKEPAALARLVQLCWERGGRQAANAVELMAMLPEEHAGAIVDRLLELAADDPLPSGVVWLMGDLGVADDRVRAVLERTVDAFVQGRGSSHAWWEATFALMKLGLLPGVPPNEDGPERDVEAAVAYAIAHRPPGYDLATSVERLRRALLTSDSRDTDFDRCDVATIAAHRGEFDAAALYRDVLKLIDVGSDGIGRRAYFDVWLAGHLRIREALPDVIRATKHPLNSVRNCAAEAVGRIGVATPEAISALEERLTDNYHRTRLHAVWSLWDLRSVESLEKLAATIRNEESRSVREAMTRVKGLLEKAKEARP